MLRESVLHMSKQADRLSIIIEYEQTILDGDSRCLELLRVLQFQVMDYLAEERAFSVQQPVEILFVHNKNSVLSKCLLDQLRIISVESTGSIDVRFIATDSSAYYIQKNIGYQRSLGSLNVFIDSDVIPDSGWLARLLEPFASPSVQVICGNTYIEPSGILEKAFALIWFHPKYEPATPLLEDSTLVKRTDIFPANNVAMRRSATSDPPFIRLQGDVRGSCAVLAAELHDRGIEIWHNVGAGASHPIPDGALGSLLRALVHGRDLIIISRYLRKRVNHGNDKNAHLWLWLKSIFGVPSAVKKRFRLVGVSFFELPVVLSICAIYYGVVISGAILTYVNTPFMLRHFRLPGQPRYHG